MRFFILILFSAFSLHATASQKVVTSIKPLQLLLASLSEGEFTAEPILPIGSSPHDYALRPQDIRTLQQNALLIWVGEELEPFFKKPLQKLPHLTQLALLEITEPDENNESTHDEHHEHHHDIDPHFWLSIDKTRHAAQKITEALINLAPEQAELRQQQLKRFNQKLDQLDAQLMQQLASIKNQGYFVFHDAYGYFEAHYQLNHLGAFTLNPQRQPGAKQLAAIKQQLTNNNASCVFAEPQFTPAIINSITRNTRAKVGLLDPLGTQIKVDGNGYFSLLQSIADGYSSCLQTTKQ